MLNSSEILTSSVVANSTMNRGRGLAGVNSYERELRFDILKFLEERVRLRGRAVWYDACCGEGHALIAASQSIANLPWGANVRLVGVDLIDSFSSYNSNSVKLQQGDVVTYQVDEGVDLVTCVHGLHYLGDKLGFLKNCYSMLAPSGMMLGQLDATNICIEGEAAGVWTRLMRNVRASGVSLKLERHRLALEKSAADLDFGVAFAGATVAEQPNYTGITVIDSWYHRDISL